MTGKIDISPAELAIVQDILRKHLPKGARTWAFGSRVTWTAKPFSDLDLAVEAASPLPLEVMGDLNEAFENSDLPWRVDVIDIKSVSPEFRAIVERERIGLFRTNVGQASHFLSGGTPQKSKKEYWGHGYPWFSASNMKEKFLRTSDLNVTEAGLKNGSRLAPSQSTLVLVRGSGLFNYVPICFADVDVAFNQDVKAIIADDDVDPVYLHYTIESKRAFLDKNIGVTGIGAGKFDTRLLEELPFIDLLYSEQKRIGAIAEAFDRKIELNRQMNQTLEAMARAVFLDWFVDFGPTRRKAAGETDPAAILGGLIPDSTKAAPLAALFPDRFGANGLPLGWEVRVVSDDFDVEMGQSPPGSTYNETGEGLPFFQGRRDFQFRFPEKRVYCSAPARTAEADWTLISVRAPVGDINRAWEKCCIGRGVGAMMHKKGLASFTYYVALHLQEELASYDKDGTVFGSINQKQIKGLSVNATNSKAAKAFDDLIVPMDEMIRNNTEENQTLAATRDLLLPRLMSGELRLVGEDVE